MVLGSLDSSVSSLHWLILGVLFVIYLYTGAPGSGKSFHALLAGWQKVHSLRRNWVVANFPVVFSKRDIARGVDRRWLYVDEPNPKDLIRLSVENGWFGHESSCLLILDEAGLMFNSRDWQVSSANRREWVKFFSQSRKFGYDVIMVAQDSRMLDRQIRSMHEFLVKHVKLRNYVWFKWLPWQFFGAISFWAGGSFRGSLRIIPFRPWLAKRYDSMRLFDYGFLKDYDIKT